ncbi:MAG: hypothetical protein QM840_08890, partial [Verrucomicrobiota bacterium]|nr:hypothetical protein [Verrucomicrobiota bacterium]
EGAVFSSTEAIFRQPGFIGVLCHWLPINRRLDLIKKAQRCQQVISLIFPRCRSRILIQPPPDAPRL